jgi:hypothetical protein
MIPSNNVAMSSPSSPFESIRGCEAYRAALSVNNYGVSMMERGHFENAIKTFDDALAIMRQTIIHDLVAADMQHSPSSADDSSCSLSSRPGKISSSAHDALQSAVFRLRAAQESCRKNGGRRPPGTLHIFPIEENDASSMRASIESGPESSLCLPIRLRGLPHSENNTSIDDNTTIPSALILRNHGLAHLLEHERQQQQQQRASGFIGLSKMSCYYHLEKAVLSLSVSHSMLAQYRSESCDDAFDLMRALMLSALVLQNLLRALLHANQHEQAQQVASALDHIGNDVQDAQQVLIAMNVETDNDTTACAA